MRLPDYKVIDTNVFMTALKNFSAHADADIPESVIDWCRSLVFAVKTAGGLVLDDRNEILDEYKSNIQLVQTPVAREFLIWLLTYCHTRPYCFTSPLSKAGDVYLDFPDDAKLKAFDPPDRKFIALACSSAYRPVVCQATDSKWWKWALTLKRHGVQVVFADDAFSEAGCRRKYKCGAKACKVCRG